MPDSFTQDILVHLPKGESILRKVLARQRPAPGEKPRWAFREDAPSLESVIFLDAEAALIGMLTRKHLRKNGGTELRREISRLREGGAPKDMIKPVQKQLQQKRTAARKELEKEGIVGILNRGGTEAAQLRNILVMTMGRTSAALERDLRRQRSLDGDGR